MNIKYMYLTWGYPEGSRSTVEELWPRPHPHVSRQRLPGHSPAFHNQALQYSIREARLPKSQKRAIITRSSHQEGWLRRGRCQELLPHLGAYVRSYPRENRGEATGRLLAWSPTTYSPGSSLVSDAATQLRRRSFACFRIFIIYAAIDHGRVVLLALLDVSAAFDTVDHDRHLIGAALCVFRCYGPGTRMDPFVSVIPLAIRPSWKLHRRHHRSVTGSFKVQFLGLCCISSIGTACGQVVWVRRAAIYADDTQLYGNCSLPMDAEDLSCSSCPWGLRP